MQQHIKFYCNESLIETEVNSTSTLLDFLRKDLKHTGTKEGCREGDCGACTVIIGSIVENKLCYKNINSCLVPMGTMNGKHVITIEGISTTTLSPIQKYFVDEGATQCGFCTPGFINSLTSYIISAEQPTHEGAIDAVSGNICRCTGYVSIRRAIEKSIADVKSITNTSSRLQSLADLGFIPAYISKMEEKLSAINSSVENSVTTDLLVSGGTDIFVQQRYSINVKEATFISLPKREIEEVGSFITIPANATISEIESSEIILKHFPSLQQDLKLFGSRPIKNKATVAGNIMNGSPIGDFVNILLALDAIIVYSEADSSSEILLKNLYTGYKSVAISKKSIITEVKIPIPFASAKFHFSKVSRRKYLDIASITSSILIAENNGIITSVNISAGGVYPHPLLLQKTCNFLLNKELSNSTLTNALEILSEEIAPISDARGSKEYKSLLLKQVILQHFQLLFPNFIDVEAILC